MCLPLLFTVRPYVRTYIQYWTIALFTDLLCHQYNFLLFLCFFLSFVVLVFLRFLSQSFHTVYLYLLIKGKSSGDHPTTFLLYFHLGKVSKLNLTAFLTELSPFYPTSPHRCDGGRQKGKKGSHNYC